MTTRARWLLLLLPLLPLGCGAGAPAAPATTTVTFTKPVPGEPAAGFATIKAEKIEAGDHVVKWRWTVRGDRMWMFTQKTSDGIRLFNSHPLGNSTMTGGSSAFEIEAAIVTQDAPDGTSTLVDTLTAASITMSRSNPRFTTGGEGGGVTTSGATTLGKLPRIKAADAFQAKLTKEKTLELPADVVLYRLEWTTADGKTQSREVRLELEQ